MASLPRRLFLLLFLASLTISSLLLFSSATSPAPIPDADDEDLSFLEEPQDEIAHGLGHGGDGDFPLDDDGEGEEDYDDSEFGGDEEFESGSVKFDESDVVVLTDRNFSEFVKEQRHLMVEFYAPWCGHCRTMAPDYAAAATELKGEDVALAKVDATLENELAQTYNIQGFPTVFFFVDGVHRDYPGQRTKDAIVTWIKKKIGPGVESVTTVEEAEKILASEDKVVLGYLDSLVGADSLEFSAASKLEDDVYFYQTVSPDVARLFHIDPNAKRPSLVVLKKEEEKLTQFEGQFSKSAIAEFVFANKLPLVITFTRDTAPEVFNNPIKRQILLFALSNEMEKVMPAFKEAAKSFKGKLIFVYVERDNEDVGKPVSEYFGVSGDSPKVLAYSGNEDAKKYLLDGEVTLENLKNFAEGFLDDMLEPFYKSDPIPETNDGDVKIVVGNNFDEIVLDQNKDVLLEIYAPWCGHCQALEPTYNKLAKHLRDIKSLVIAKMDGTTNEHPRAKADGFPTLLFFPAGHKDFDPISVDTDRTVVALYKFMKSHVSIPFKLQRPAPATKFEVNDAYSSESQQSTSTGVKDEL